MWTLLGTQLFFEYLGWGFGSRKKISILLTTPFHSRIMKTQKFTRGGFSPSSQRALPQLDSSVSNLPKKPRPGEVQQRRKGNPNDLEPKKKATIFQRVGRFHNWKPSVFWWKKNAGPKIFVSFWGWVFWVLKISRPDWRIQAWRYGWCIWRIEETIENPATSPTRTEFFPDFWGPSRFSRLSSYEILCPKSQPNPPKKNWWMIPPNYPHQNYSHQKRNFLLNFFLTHWFPLVRPAIKPLFLVGVVLRVALPWRNIPFSK